MVENGWWIVEEKWKKKRVKKSAFHWNSGKVERFSTGL
jgi:hypothetical protein